MYLHSVIYLLPVTSFAIILTIFAMMGSSKHISQHQTERKLYFGYGSNLWREQMLLRCPSSEYLGIARLDGWYWIINDRGYANVVQKSTNSVENTKGGDEVWGLVYSLTPTDEARLDVNEGVPFAYTKEMHLIDFWPTGKTPEDPIDRMRKPEQESILVYVDRKRTVPDKPKKEYIHRMNMGIADALKAGVPEEYINSTLRMYIPPETVSKDIETFAKQQALEFKDENIDAIR
jgi:hypothetical protein